MSNTITTQLISYDLSGFTAMVPYEAIEEAFSCGPIALCLKIDINHFAIPVDRPPKVMLPAVGLHEDFVDEEGIAVPPVLSFQPSSV